MRARARTNRFSKADPTLDSLRIFGRLHFVIIRGHGIKALASQYISCRSLKEAERHLGTVSVHYNASHALAPLSCRLSSVRMRALTLSASPSRAGRRRKRACASVSSSLRTGGVFRGLVTLFCDCALLGFGHHPFGVSFLLLYIIGTKCPWLQTSTFSPLSL